MEEVVMKICLSCFEQVPVYEDRTRCPYCDEELLVTTQERDELASEMYLLKKTNMLVEDE